MRPGFKLELQSFAWFLVTVLVRLGECTLVLSLYAVLFTVSLC
jgi:hypothetical protein